MEPHEIALVQDDKKCYFEQKSAVLAAILDFVQSWLIEIDSPWSHSYMSLIHTVPLQAKFKDILGFL